MTSKCQWCGKAKSHPLHIFSDPTNHAYPKHAFQPTPVEHCRVCGRPTRQKERPDLCYAHRYDS